MRLDLLLLARCLLARCLSWCRRRWRRGMRLRLVVEIVAMAMASRARLCSCRDPPPLGWWWWDLGRRRRWLFRPRRWRRRAMLELAPLRGIRMVPGVVLLGVELEAVMELRSRRLLRRWSRGLVRGLWRAGHLL